MKYKDLIKPKLQTTKKDTTSNGSNSDDWTAALNKAWEIRNFEIELFWKRTAYFSVLVGALFIAYYTILGKDSSSDNAEFYKIIISFLGFVASLVWFLSNKGSKFWQENWELHIDYIEKISKQNKIHSLVLSRINKKSDLLGACEFSVSKLNTLFSYIVSLAWLVILICNIFVFGYKYWEYKTIFIIVLVLTLMLIWAMRRFKINLGDPLVKSCKSSFTGCSEGFIDENDNFIFIESKKPKKENKLKFYQKQ